MRILITGCAGHVGSKLVEWILREEPSVEHVVGVDDLSCGYLETAVKLVESSHGRFWFKQCDAGDQRVVNDHGPFDAVFHLAAYAAECMSAFCRRYNYQNNLVSTAGLVSNLIDAGFRGRLVFTSSMAAYGDARGSSPPFSESMHCSPKDPYGVAKLACERDIAIAGEQHGLDWCVLRPHNIYGPGQSLWQKYRNVIGLWMRAVLENKPITIFGDGEQKRAFSYVDDVVPCIWRAATYDCASGHVINLGGREPVTINDLYDILCAVVGRDVAVDRQPARHEVKLAYCTTRHSEELLEYREATTLVDGVKRMWTWAQDAWERYPNRVNITARPTTEDLDTRVKMPAKWLADYVD